MAIPQCPVTITCDNQRDVDSPFGNYSAEAPDIVQFVGNRFPNPNPNNPLGPGTGTDPNTPNPPPAWFANGCLGLCFSTDSQAAADACANSQAYICANDGGGNGGGPDNPPNGPITGGPGQGGPGTPTIFFNLSQTCSFTCPDGSLFLFTVPAGTIPSSSQVLADTIAQSLACQSAAAKHICLGNITSPICLGVFSAKLLNPQGGTPPYTFALTAGALPPGMILEQSGSNAQIAGVPSTAGNYTFTIMATDASGNSITKVYALSVFGVTNIGAMPPMSLNSPYAFQFVAAGGTPPYTFIVAGGSLTLPAGISLSSTGLLSGTPTAVGGSTFTLAVTDFS